MFPVTLRSSFPLSLLLHERCDQRFPHWLADPDYYSMDFRLEILESGCGTEYEKFRTAADAAKTAYVEALQTGDTPLELKKRC